METLPLLTISGAAIGGVLVGAATCYWTLSRAITELRSRLERSEQARNGAVERSTNAREQIAQLNQAIDDLRRTHSTQLGQSASRDRLNAILAEGEEKTLVLPKREAPPLFADTEVMSKL